MNKIDSMGKLEQHATKELTEISPIKSGIYSRPRLSSVDSQPMMNTLKNVKSSKYLKRNGLDLNDITPGPSVIS